MIGAIIGDIVGSRFEFHNHLSKDFEFLTQDCRFTDDTVMTCAVARALMDSKEDYSDLSEKTITAMQQIGQKFPNCGYGARFIHWMFSDNPQPYNSCGNGSAMRISPIGFVARDVDEAKKLSAAVTCISHDHPEGMKGAEATAVAIVMAREGKSKDEIKTVMEEYYDLSMTVEQYRDEWQGHGKEICQISLPQALVCFFEGESYEDVIRNCISIGGDSDTIAAIAGGIAEAYYGVPEEYWIKAERYLPWSLLQIVLDFQDWAKTRKLTSDKEMLTEEQKAVMNGLNNIQGEVCILKKTYEGNTHDENWQNHIYVLNKDPWNDKFDEICKTGHGWAFDEPLIQYFSDLSECVEDWAIYNCDRNSWEVYTCEYVDGKLIRRVYGIHSFVTIPRGADEKWYDPEVARRIRVLFDGTLKSEEIIELKDTDPSEEQGAGNRGNET